MRLVEIGENWIDPRIVVGAVWIRGALHALAHGIGPVLASNYTSKLYGSQEAASVALIHALEANLPEGFESRIVQFDESPKIVPAAPAATSTDPRPQSGD